MASAKKAPLAKNTTPYWLNKLYKPKNALGTESPHYNFRFVWKGTRYSFSTGTGNKDKAARIAAGIYNDFLTLGELAALEKHKPKKKISGKIATVGEWIEAAKAVMAVEPATFHDYCRSLRKIVGDIAKIKRDQSRFSPTKGGADVYRSKVDAVSLEVLTLTALQKWRIAYVDEAKDPSQNSSKMTSANSTIVQAGSLFAPSVLFHVKDLVLPKPAPFEVPPELKKTKRGSHPLRYPTQNTKYRSKIDARKILKDAHEHLSVQDEQVYLAFLLAIGAGLRRKEIDTLTWDQIDCQKGIISVEVTESASLKSAFSEAEVETGPQTARILQGFKAKAKGTFVLQGSGKTSNKKRRTYRANATLTKLITWLRKQGVNSQKPIHELRKEIGSLMNDQFGIYSASRFLRHGSVAVTEASYIDKKDKTTVDVGAWLGEGEVIPMKPESPLVTAMRGRQRSR
jgi:integrase